jgi:hypothetical protein
MARGHRLHHARATYLYSWTVLSAYALTDSALQLQCFRDKNASREQHSLKALEGRAAGAYARYETACAKQLRQWQEPPP